MLNIYKIFGSLVLLALLFGCQKAEQPITMIGEDSANIQAIQSLEAKYEQEKGQPIEILAYAFEESFEKSTVDFASGTGKYDIVMQYNFSLSSFVRNDYVYPFDELKTAVADDPSINLDFESDLFPKVWKELGYYFADRSSDLSKIAAVGYPFAANTMLMIYNKTMFNDLQNQTDYFERYNEQLAVPKTWEQYKRIAEFFTNPEKDSYGVAMHGSGSGWLYYEWTNFVFSLGDGVSSKEQGWEGNAQTEITLNSPANQVATQMFVDLKPYNKGSFFDVDGTQHAKLIQEGNVAMGLMWIDYIFPYFTDEDGNFDDRFGFAPIPGNTSMIAGGAFFINRDSDQAVEAFKYVTWLLQEDNQVELVKQGLASPRRSVYQSPDVQHIPYINALRESLERAEYFLEAGPDANLISQAVSESIQRAWRGELSVKEALDAAQRRVDSERPAIFDAIK